MTSSVRLSLEFLRLALEITQEHGAELRNYLAGVMLSQRGGMAPGPEGVSGLECCEALADSLRTLLSEARQQAHLQPGSITRFEATRQQIGYPSGSAESLAGRSVSSLPSSATDASLASTAATPMEVVALGRVGGARAVKRGRARSSSGSDLDAARVTERIPGLSRHRTAGGQSSMILSNVDLLSYTFRFLIGEATGESRPILSTLSLVCRKWRDLSRKEEFWRPIAKDCFPVLAEGSRIEGIDTTYRSYLLKYGRDLVDRRVWLGDEWAEHLRLSFEVFDQHDGLRLLSATGSLGIYIDEADGVTALEVKGKSRKEVAGPAFSAAGRDPRNTTISEYFETAHREDRQSCICVRVTVWDERTGRSGTLWSSSKNLPFLTAPPNHHWQQALPPDSLVVVPRGWTSLVSPATQPVYLQAQVLFHVRPDDDQAEDVAPQDRLYRLAVAGPDSPDAGPPRSCIELVLSTANRVVLGNYIRSILA